MADRLRDTGLRGFQDAAYRFIHQRGVAQGRTSVAQRELLWTCDSAAFHQSGILEPLHQATAARFFADAADGIAECLQRLREL